MIESPVLTWNQTAIAFMQSIVDDDDLDRSVRSTANAGRVYALLNVAMHDALAGMVGPTLLPRQWVTSVPSLPIRPSRTGVAEFAVIGAGSAFLEDVFAKRERKAEVYAIQRRLIESHAPEDRRLANRALEHGRSLALALLDDDRFAVPPADPDDDPHVVASGLGNLGFANTGNYRNLGTFIIDRSNRHHAPPPPVLTSDDYARDWHEVYAVGSAAVREASPDSTESRMARLWSGGAGTAQESGYWPDIARRVLEGRDLPLVQQVRVMTAVAAANCDAMVSSWNSKWTYTYWRPRAAIHAAHNDGNPTTFRDDTWEPFNGGQGASPEHTSGTATFAGAGATILGAFFGDFVEFDVDFQKETGRAESATFPSFGLAADVASNSRVYNGIHFRFSGDSGLSAGRAIGREALLRLGVDRLP